MVELPSVPDGVGSTIAVDSTLVLEGPLLAAAG